MKTDATSPNVTTINGESLEKKVTLDFKFTDRDNHVLNRFSLTEEQALVLLQELTNFFANKLFPNDKTDEVK